MLLRFQSVHAGAAGQQHRGGEGGEWCADAHGTKAVHESVNELFFLDVSVVEAVTGYDGWRRFSRTRLSNVCNCARSLPVLRSNARCATRSPQALMRFHKVRPLGVSSMRSARRSAGSGTRSK